MWTNPDQFFLKIRSDNFPPPDLMILQGNCCKGRVGNESREINGAPASTPILLECISASVQLSSTLLMPLLTRWLLFSLIDWKHKKHKRKMKSCKNKFVIVEFYPLMCCCSSRRPFKDITAAYLNSSDMTMFRNRTACINSDNWFPLIANLAHNPKASSVKHTLEPLNMISSTFMLDLKLLLVIDILVWWSGDFLPFLEVMEEANFKRLVFQLFFMLLQTKVIEK